MQRSYRERKGSFIELIPVDGPNIDQPHDAIIKWDSSANVEDLKMTVHLEPCGFPGYNIRFSTDKKLEEILKAFANFISPNSRIHADDESIGYNEMKLNEVSPEIIRRMSEAEEMWLRLDQTEDPSKLKLFWYETPILDSNGRSIAYTREFDFNIGRYWNELMCVAYEVTDYPIGGGDISWFKSFLESTERK